MKEISHNFLLKQYKLTNELPINHNYLPQQFQDSEEVIDEIRKLVVRGDFTLGSAVNEFEAEFKKISNTRYAIGVGSGTDALFLSLKALGIKEGDEVITTPYTFYATIGAIVTAGAIPKFVDIGSDYNIDPNLIEEAITSNTKAIVPVHWSGLLCDMDSIRDIADRHNLSIVEDACHAINAKRNNKTAGSIGDTACFSMHPLKNLNVWGDGGIIVTNNKELHDKLVLLRNHGLRGRDICDIFAYNSRLDTLQAIVGNHYIKKIDHITDMRIKNAHFYDNKLSDISQIEIPSRSPEVKQVFHLYCIRVSERDDLQKYLIKNGIDAKVHYPIPMHLQPAAKDFGYSEGDFPHSEKLCKEVLSLPVHEFIIEEQMNFTVQKIKEFYS
jgi:dTDP-3-amino-2,3,6-trideoxy-4-keto-D-glucose/dTDP-3-amino-3,4,6-trideoxy-alpha-D-glucose/dTDP-2,6-dideoxy-D-kanosamine transaminase